MNALRVWLSAIRPRTLLASLGPVLVGSALAAAEGHFRFGVALAALVGAMLIQIGTNLHNDYEDARRGADTEERLGPARATQKGWLTPQAVAGAAALSMLLAIAVGLYLVSVAGWPIFWVGLVSVLAGLSYTGGPAPLAYTGLGDLFVLLFFGFVAVSGTAWCHGAPWGSPQVLLGGLVVGLQATAILVVNNIRDRHTDVKAGKRTLAVRFGRGVGLAEYALCMLGPYLLLAAAAAAGLVGFGWLLPLLSLPLALHRVQRVWRIDGAALNPELGGTAQLGLVCAALLALGVWL